MIVIKLNTQPAGKINGFFALSEKNSWADVKPEPIVEKGPAFGKVKAARQSSGDWPTYRGNAARGGATECAVPAKPKVKWKAEIGPTITAPVIADGKVFVADRDAYTVHCLDQKSGKKSKKGRCCCPCGTG